MVKQQPSIEDHAMKHPRVALVLAGGGVAKLKRHGVDESRILPLFLSATGPHGILLSEQP